MACLMLAGAAIGVSARDVAAAPPALAADAPQYLTAIAPSRVVDTRPGRPIADSGPDLKGVRTSGTVLRVPIAGRVGVPEDARTAMLNLTAPSAQTPGYVTAYGCEDTPPNASTLNLLPGSTIANSALIPLDGDGNACVYVSGSTDLVVDVTGYGADRIAGPATGTLTKTLVPLRLVDTRASKPIGDDAANPKGRRTTGQILKVPVTGRGEVPISANAALLNLTAVDATRPGFLTAYPCDSPRPNASNVNLMPGHTVANAALVRLDSTGSVCIYSQGDTDLVIDINGFIAGPADVADQTDQLGAATATAVTPIRIVDTRTGYAIDDEAADPKGQRTDASVLQVAVAGRGGVPDEATGAFLNITSVRPEAAGYITAYPCGSTPPQASNLNLQIGRTVAVNAYTALDADGNVCLYNRGTTDLVVDVGGYTTGASLAVSPPNSTSTTIATTPPVNSTDTSAPSDSTSSNGNIRSNDKTPTAARAKAPCANLGSGPLPFNEAMEPLTDDPRGPVLFHLDCWVNRPRDNAITLLSGAARQRGVVQRIIHHAKYVNAREWDATSDVFVWTVDISKRTTFNVQLNMTSGRGDRFLLDVVGTSNRLSFGPSDITTYDLLEPGKITIPAGRHELRLRKTASRTNSNLIGLSLVRSSDYAAYQQRVDDFRVDTSWMRGKRGYMVQWGSWSYPRTGPGGTDQQAWNQFNVKRFVDEMIKAKVDYVVWSVSWTQYRFPGPIKAIDRIADPTEDRTANRDLLMEVGRALRDRGIPMVIYYHVGHERGAENGTWWAKQDFPDGIYTHNGYGDRTTFFNNWKAVIREVGNRYKWLIRGFFFDDGNVYYGADFEALGQVARTGFADRFVSFNFGDKGPGTQFQDVYFGENNCFTDVDWNGRLVSGAYKGMFAQCMTRAHNNWGSYVPNDPNPGYVRSPIWYYRTYRRPPDQGAMSLSNMMYDGPTFIDKNEDGTTGDGNKNTGLAADIVPDYVSGIDVGIDGSLYATAPDRRIYTTSGEGWQALTRDANTSFGARGPGSIYYLRDGELIYRRSATRSDNLGNSGYSIASISVGADGSVFGLTTGGELIRRAGGRWVPQNTGTTRWKAVSVGKRANDVWLLDAKGDPYRFDGKAVKRYAASTVRFKEIEAATNGDLLAIGTNGALYEYRGWRWVKRTEVARVSEIAANSKDDFWFIDADTRWLGHVDGTDVIKAHRSSIR